jgi:DNA-binding transcriptional ArsR family regulator
MDVVESIDRAASEIASAIGELARARILYSLMDGRARTGTELSAIADIGTSTASAHLNRLIKTRLVVVAAEGRHRYYRLAGPEVAQILEGLTAIAGVSRPKFNPSTPNHLRQARTCYDHIAGSLGVMIHDRLIALKWIRETSNAVDYEITAKGLKRLMEMGIDVSGFSGCRRRVAFGCLDWSERRHHLGGSLGAAILKLACKRKWLLRDLDGRGLSPTAFGRQEFLRHFGLDTAV